MSLLHIFTLAGWLTVVIVARLVRGRPYATAAGVLVGVYSLLALAMAPLFGRAMPLFYALHAGVYLNFAALARPRMRPLVYRLLVSWPASFFIAGTLLALPWAIALSLGFHPWAPWLPYALGAVGLLQSLTSREEEIDLVIGGAEDGAPAVAPHPRGAAREERPLRIVQITDPHIGPFMSVARLRRIAARAVAKKPGPRVPDRRLPDDGVAGRSGAAPPRARAPPGDAGQGLRVLRQPRPRGARDGRERARRQRRSRSSWTRRARSRPKRGRCRSSAWTSSGAIARSTSSASARSIRASRA